MRQRCDACRYILRVALPQDYPMSAPDFFMMTPNGRFGVNTKICTTFSSFHPETWTPSYTLSTLLVSFISFFCDTMNAAGAVHTSDAEKKRFASASLAFNKKQRSQHSGMAYSDMLPMLQHLISGTNEAIKTAWAKRYPEKAKEPKQPPAPAASTTQPSQVHDATSAAPLTLVPKVPSVSERQPLVPRTAVDLSAGKAARPNSGATPVGFNSKKRAAHTSSNPDEAIVLDVPTTAIKAARTSASGAARKAPAAATGAIDLT